jgi:hypothetical protein
MVRTRTPTSKSVSAGRSGYFDSSDPSPFHERDLDDDAGAYIVDTVDAFPLQAHFAGVLEHDAYAGSVSSKRP